jgi:diguanylate cyclase (GGDEF)-like protein
MNRSGARPVWLAVIAGAVIAGSLLSALWRFYVLSPHNTIRDLTDLPLQTMVHLTGKVTFVDGPGKRFWIEDETGGIPVAASPDQAPLQVGETVSIEATKTAMYDPEQGTPSVGLQQIKVGRGTGNVKLQHPIPVTLADFPTSDKNGTKIEMSGIVRFANVDGDGRTELYIGGTGSEIQLTFAHFNGDYAKLLDTRIRITGVSELTRDPRTSTVTRRVWIPSEIGVKVEEPAPSSTRLYSVRSLYQDSGARSGHLVRVRGRVASLSANALALEDRWGAIDCQLALPPEFKPGTPIEVDGFPSMDGLRVKLVHARAAVIQAANIENESDPASKLPVFTSAHEVRELSPERAALALPVHLTGEVTYLDSAWNQLYLQDESGGIYTKYAGDSPGLRVGMRVALTGITNAGDFAPVVVAPKIHVLEAAHMPVPVAVTATEAAAGLRDSRYVTIEGVIHPMTVQDQPGHRYLIFEMITALGQVHVYTSPQFPDSPESRNFEDARVSIRGVFGTIFNTRRQLVGYQLLVQSPSDIEVIEPAVAKPFGMKATPIEALLRFSPHSRFGHRVKVKGTVTLVSPDSLYLQDETDGVEIRGNTQSIKVGDVVEAIGYPTLVGSYSPVLTDAEFRTSGHPGSITPKAATAESILEGHDDYMLLTVEGKLLMALNGPGRKSLVMQSGVRTFTAQLNTSDHGVDLRDISEGSTLRLTGVCSTQVDPEKLYTLLEHAPSDFQILLRSAQDLTVVREAPFWTLKKTLGLLAVFSLLIPATLIWIGVLRRRVALQMAELERAAETSQAIKDLSLSMRNVSTEQRFDTQVSVRGSEDISQLVIGFNCMLSELQQRDRDKMAAEAKLQHMAMVDELTGLPNRRLLFDRLPQSLARARRQDHMMAMLYIDLDGFKLVNDNLGHAVGDLLLGQVAQRLKSRSRQSDILARIGGDEFTLVLEHINSRSDAEKAAFSLLDSLAPPFPIEGHNIQIGASIGISIFPEHGIEGGQLLQQADSAMYAAKRNGKNRIVQFGDDLEIATRERMTVENELRLAISEDAITVHYQPEYDLATNSIIRFEALARWTHETLGPISPLHFISIAEENGLIHPLGAYIMEQACRDALTWHDAFGRDIQVAVNVSSMQFAQNSFVDDVGDILRRTGLKPSLLQIELTESATLAGMERTAEMIQRLKDMGLSVALDDFGTGYSCLNYLPKLPFDALKIDRSFVKDLTVRPESSAFFQSIVTMAHNLHMKVIVEGIETAEELERVVELGADAAQGYLLGRPSADPVGAFVVTRDAPEPIGIRELLAG